MKLNSLSIKRRLTVGFGAVLILLLLLAGLAFWYLTDSIATLKIYREAEKDNSDIVAVRKLVFSSSLSLEQFMVSKDQMLEAKIDKDLSELRSMLVKLRSDSEINTRLGDLDRAVDNYANSVDKIVSDMLAREKLFFDILIPSGTKITSSLASLEEDLQKTNELNLAIDTGTIAAEFLNARLVITRLMFSWKLADIEDIQSYIKSAIKRSSSLATQVKTDKQKQLASGISEGLLTYQQGSENTFVLTRTLDPLIRSTKQEVESVTMLVGNLQANLAKEQQQKGNGLVSDLTTVSKVIVGFAFVALLVGLAFSTVIANSITAPLNHAVFALKDISEGEGDLTKTVVVEGEDEVAAMAKYLNAFMAKLRTTVANLASNSNSLASAATELGSITNQISANAAETSTQASIVSSAAEEVNSNMSSVASASEEMVATIHEVAQNASNAARVSTEAVNSAKATNEVVQRLGIASTQIGNIVSLITSIAEQTNLLALNATIEAARAGEAGKGFAVVANEVKELAKQTAKATDEIAKEIQAIQTDTASTVSAIQDFIKIIQKLSNISDTIATAVEEQTATTKEITRSVTEASQGTNEIARNIVGVAQAAESTATGVSESAATAAALARTAEELSGIVGQFKY